MSFAFPAPVSLSHLLKSVDARVSGDVDTRVTGMTQDSRNVQPGDMYCCVRGEHFDGHDFVHQAIAAGAVALLVDGSVEGIPASVAVVTVESVRAVLGAVAASGFGEPAQSLTIVGVTGTNGKTSTAAIIASIFRANGDSVRVFGTLSGIRTTPEAIELQSLLREALSDGITHVVMEVSSHALHQGRVASVTFAVGVFTNIARDHLDYHGTEENYFAAKAMLFAPGCSRIGVINVDDTRGRLLVDVGGIPMRSFSIADIDSVATEVGRVSFQWRGHHIEVPMGGQFTVMNALAAISAADALGIPLDSIVRGCAQMEQVKGRFESVPNDLGIGVVVDYAHTPDGLEKVLQSARALTTQRVIVVFGCGGDRDAGKRPQMGAIASVHADVVYVTSDNPRSEDPRAIIEQILSGMSFDAQKSTQIWVDRALAIESAISLAERGDIVVIAGKGHETTQEIDGALTPFNDVEVAAAALRTRKGDAS